MANKIRNTMLSPDGFRAAPRKRTDAEIEALWLKFITPGNKAVKDSRKLDAATKESILKQFGYIQ